MTSNQIFGIFEDWKAPPSGHRPDLRASCFDFVFPYLPSLGLQVLWQYKKWYCIYLGEVHYVTNQTLDLGCATSYVILFHILSVYFVMSPPPSHFPVCTATMHWQWFTLLECTKCITFTLLYITLLCINFPHQSYDVCNYASFNTSFLIDMFNVINRVNTHLGKSGKTGTSRNFFYEIFHLWKIFLKNLKNVCYCFVSTWKTWKNNFLLCLQLTFLCILANSVVLLLKDALARFLVL